MQGFEEFLMQGSVMQGFVGFDPQGFVTHAQGSVPQGSVPQGFVPQGFVTQGTVTQGFVPQATNLRDAPNEPPAKKARQSAARDGISKKELTAKLKAATVGELKELIRSLHEQHPAILNPALEAFEPRLLPVQPSPDDYFVTHCFHCKGGSDRGLTQLHKSEAMQICSGCRDALFGKYSDTCTREKVMKHFNLSKTEAGKITSCGRSGSNKCFVYHMDAVMKAVKRKYGSLCMMVEMNM